jgi:Rad52/22 family double-strand break repair protein
MDDTIFKGFYEQLPVKSRKGRGGTYPYVAADDITDRMNRLFKGNWSSYVTYQDVIGDEIVIRVRVEVSDGANMFYHEGFGGHKMNPTDEPGNGFKSAYSKALVNACRRWGVGLFLTEDEENINMNGKPGPKPSVPVDIPITPSAPKEDVQAQFITPKSRPKVSESTTIVQEKPKMDMPKIPIPGMGTPKQSSSVPPEIAASVKKTISSIPKIPTQATSIVSQPTETAPDDAGDPGISDVQLLAIDSLVETKGFKYEDLAEHVLGEVRDVNNLTHDEAIAVIQYGNKLYRESKQK